MYLFLQGNMKLMKVRRQSTKTSTFQLKQWGRTTCPIAFLGKGGTRRSFFLTGSVLGGLSGPKIVGRGSIKKTQASTWPSVLDSWTRP